MPVLRPIPSNQTYLLLYAVAWSMLAFAPGASAEGRHYKVVIEGMKFTPSVLEISAGDAVEWINKDFFPHNATADDRSFSSEEIAAGKSWQWTAVKRGMISYSCSLHPSMKATLVVK